MSRDGMISFIEPSGLDGAATITADVTEYFVMPNAGHIVKCYSLVESAPDFTTTDEQGRVLIDYDPNGDGNFADAITIHTENLANANTWTALVPKAHVISTLSGGIPIRIPAGVLVRVRFDVNGTTPSFPTLHVAIGVQFIAP